MRFVSLVLVLAACGGGGSSSAAIVPPPDPPNTENPAPAPDRGAAVDLAGIWRVVESQVIQGFGQSLPVGSVLEIVPGAGSYEILNLIVPTGSGSSNVTVRVLQDDIEDFAGFPLDWYENEGDGSFLDYGYGWDRLRVAGGGGALHDFYQYGLRLAPESPTVLAGYEAEWIESLPSEGRYKRLATVRLMRTP